MSHVLNLRLGTRNSPLALAQAARVEGWLRAAWPQLALDTVSMTTLGDRALDASFSQLVAQGHAGVFVKELETALLSGAIDLAVHSFKDLPSKQPDGLSVLPLGPRDDPRDALILNPNFLGTHLPDLATLETLPTGSRIGTASTRRTAMLVALRPDLICLPVRGNLQTRLRKLGEGQFDALLLAKAGFDRLSNLAERFQVIPVCPRSQLIPAPAQGMLAVEYRLADQDQLAPLLAPLLPPPGTQACIAAERAVLVGLAAGCQVPLGVFAEVSEGHGHLIAVMAQAESQKLHRVTSEFNPTLEGALTAAAEIVAQLKPYAPLI